MGGRKGSPWVCPTWKSCIIGKAVCARLQGPVGGPPQPFRGSDHMVRSSKPSLHPLRTRPRPRTLTKLGQLLQSHTPSPPNPPLHLLLRPCAQQQNGSLGWKPKCNIPGSHVSVKTFRVQPEHRPPPAHPASLIPALQANRVLL